MSGGPLKCALAHLGGCRGPLEWHHVIGKNRLKREFKYGARRAGPAGWRPATRYTAVTADTASTRTLDSILGDRRNRMWVCSEGHHERITNARVRADVPGPVWEFAREFGLVGMLENDLARVAG